MRVKYSRYAVILAFSTALVCILLLVWRSAPVPSEPPSGTDTGSVVYRIGVSFPMTDLMFRAKMLSLLEQYQQDHAGEVTFIILDGQNSQRQQNQDLMELVDTPVDGIILIPYTMEGTLPVIQYANDKQIPVMTLDNRVEDSTPARVISYVGADHVQMGCLAAQLLVSALERRFPEEQQWNVIYLTGIPNSAGAVDRDTGIKETLDQEPRITLLGEFNGEFTRQKSCSIMEDCLNIYPCIHGVICQNDLMAEGCYQALENYGLAGRVSIIGIDGQRSVVEKIAEQKIDGTILQYPDMILHAVEYMRSYLNGQPLQYAYYQQIDPITFENAQACLDAGLSW